MKTCKECNKELVKKSEEKQWTFNLRMFCDRSCAGSYNNRLYPKRMRGPDKICGCGRNKRSSDAKCGYCRRSVCEKHGIEKVRKGKRFKCPKCASEYVHNRRIAIKKMAIEYKGGSCQKCGYNKCAAALQFHHAGDHKKEFGIAARGSTRSWENVKRELNKCILLCANCHAEEHWGNSIVVMHHTVNMDE